MKNLINFFRLIKVATTLARHDALFLLNQIGISTGPLFFLKIFTLGSNKTKRPGEKMADAFNKLGPVFIKLGQSLSTRSDLLGDQVAADLAVLQDKMPAFPSAIARKIIEDELAVKISDIFSEFNDTPTAAASIAQVHFAKDHAGNELAVKVLRPDIESRFASDFELLHWLAGIAEKRLPKRLKPRAAVEEFEKTVRLEMDLRMEAAAASELKENFADYKDNMHLIVPLVDWTKTGRTVLTMQRLSGIHINDKATLQAQGFDLSVVLERAANIVFKMVLVDGFFHADMHPGNMFITKNGEVAVVDFGIMGRVDLKTRRYLAEMLYGFLRRDYKRVARVHFEAGYVPAHQSEELFAQACRSIGEPILGLPQNQISVARLLSQLFKISEQFEMELQPQLLLLQKTMMLTEGIGRSLNPNVNIWQLAEPLMEKWAEDNMGTKARLKEGVSNIHEFAGKVTGYLDSIKMLAAVATPEGIKLHPETVRLLKKK